MDLARRLSSQILELRLGSDKKKNSNKQTMQYSKSSFVALLACAPMASAFAPSAKVPVVTARGAVVDPTTITNKEYEDICGVNFGEQSLEERLVRTSYLYPKHVEVVEDLAPMVDIMVDEVVSSGSVGQSELVCMIMFESIQSFAINRSLHFWPVNCFRILASILRHKSKFETAQCRNCN